MGLVGGGIPVGLSNMGEGKLDVANHSSNPQTNAAAYTIQTGSEVGGGVGAAIGALAGSFLGPGGAAVGGIVGGLIGSNVGEAIGHEKVAKNTSDSYADHVQESLDGNGTYSTILGGGGGALGAVIGSALGPVGTVIGAAVGGGLGGGIGANFGCGLIAEIKDDCHLF